MRFSVVMASYLGDYPNAAKNREGKILRAVNSVLVQTLDDFEIVVVADGCKKTLEIMKQVEDPRVHVFAIPKARQWSGEPRNKGIQEAKGDYIIYLDIDDIFGENHLRGISDNLSSYDWVWFNDIRYAPKTNEWYENPCEIDKIGRHGTSNVCHKRQLPAKWDYTGYAHDYYFIEQLRKIPNYTKIDAGEYYVCHIPNPSTGGYDV